MVSAFKRHFSLRLLIVGVATLAIVSMLVVYGFFQARLLLLGPRITLATEPETVQPARTVHISGTAENIVALTLNDRAIFTDDNGWFSETLVLPEGYTIMTLKAVDRYGRETTYSHPFIYQPTT